MADGFPPIDWDERIWCNVEINHFTTRSKIFGTTMKKIYYKFLYK